MGSVKPIEEALLGVLGSRGDTSNIFGKRGAAATFGDIGETPKSSILCINDKNIIQFGAIKIRLLKKLLGRHKKYFWGAGRLLKKLLGIFKNYFWGAGRILKNFWGEGSRSW
jgi:hypothetical protein